MSEIARWAGHVFEVTPRLVLSLNTLIIKSGVELDDMEAGSQQYVSRKAGKAAEVSFEVPLSGFLGVDVRGEAMRLIDEARKGTQDYFYIGGSKLMTCQLMLTEASVSETEIGPGGKWTACKVKLTMKQSSKYDGEEGEGHKIESSTGYEKTAQEKGLSGSGSKKSSVSTKTPLERLVSAASKAIPAMRAAAEKAGKTVSAVSEIKRMTSAAKSKTASTKTIKGSWANNLRR